MRREAITLPDGDELVLDHLDADSPVHFVLMHGLEGSAHSVYMQGILNEIRKQGGSATAMNFRSCARDLSTLFGTIPNRSPRFYHSGEITDFNHTLRLLAERMPERKFVAFGASLGGNALLSAAASKARRTPR